MINSFSDARTRSALISLFILIQIYAVRYIENPYRDEIFLTFNSLYFLLGFFSIDRRQAIRNFLSSVLPVAGFILIFLFLYKVSDIRSLIFHQRTEISFKVWLFLLISAFFSFYLGRTIRILVFRAYTLALRIMRRWKS